MVPLLRRGGSPWARRGGLACMKSSLLLFALLLLVAAGGLSLRLVELEARPMHNDEANQAVRCGQLLTEGTYTYDPIEFHGPSLYYLSLPIAWLTVGGDFTRTSEATFRLVTVLFGAGLVLLLGLVGDGMGRTAAVCGAVLTAASPAMVYYSRFYIQETLLVFFTFGIIAAGWRWLRTGKVAWALLTGFFVGMAHATKETCIIAFAAIGLGSGLELVLKARRGKGRSSLSTNSRPDPVVRVGHLAAAAVVAVVVSIVFFSSFGANWAGPLDSVRTYANYFRKAGANTEHVHPWYYYLKMLAFSRYGRGPVWTEALILVLALVGLGSALNLILNGGAGSKAPLSIKLRADPGFVVFMVVYTVFMTVAYSVIPYKTPWCMLSFLQGMTVLAGIGAATLIKASKRTWVRVVVAVLLAVPTGHLVLQARDAAVKFGADSRNPYVYSQTSTDYLKLVERVENIAKVSPDGFDTLIEVIAHPHSTWPLPWDLRKFTRVGYWTDVGDAPHVPDVPIIIASPETADALVERVGDRYLMEFYGLRPNVLLNIYIRRDLWDAFLATRSGITAGDRRLQ